MELKLLIQKSYCSLAPTILGRVWRFARSRTGASVRTRRERSLISWTYHYRLPPMRLSNCSSPFKTEPPENQTTAVDHMWLGLPTFRQNQPVIHEQVSLRRFG